MATVESKQIVIPFRGPIYPKAAVQGPITTPYVEKVDVIASLLFGNYPVTEVLADGTKVKLNFTNFNKDNTPAPKKEEAPKEEANTVKTAPAAVTKPADVKVKPAVTQSTQYTPAANANKGKVTPTVDKVTKK